MSEAPVAENESSNESIRLDRFEGPNRLIKNEDTATECYAQFVAEPFERGFGHTIGKTIAFAYLPPAEAVHSDYVIEAFGREIQVTRHDQCLYDPKRERILS